MRELTQRFCLLCLSGAFLAGVPALAEPPGPAPKAAEAEATPRFDVWEYRVEGNTVLDPKVIEKTVYGYLGPGKTIDDVEKARAALEKVYHDAGYAAALVDIPEQDVNEGVVVLTVGEGRVDRLKVSGSRYFSLGRIREKVPALAEGKPLHMPAVQEQLSELAGESADRNVTPILRAGRTPGTVEVDLAVEDRLPLHGSLELNARNSANTSRLRLIGMLRYDNLWQRFHSASLQYQTSPEDPSNVEVWSGTYVMPLDFLGARLAFYGIGLDSTSNVTTAGALSVVGSGHIFGLRLIKLLPGTKAYSHSLTLGWDYKDFGQSVLLTGADTQNTPVTYAPWQVSYTGTYGWGGGTVTQWNLETDFNIAGIGSTYREFENRRYGATPNYLYLAGDLRHRQALPWDLALQFRLLGQVANMPLISNEQMGAGGMQSVRGYHEVERLGDDGVNGSLELYSPNLGPWLDASIDEWRFLVFSDVARLWIRKPLPGAPSSYDLWSAGTGFRLQLLKQIAGEFYWAYPFAPGQYVKVGQSRIDFRVVFEF
ncbi:ShlB/FhaC/HecB family hemolysin secretion/activation protein [Candidatus Methylocalor cossyra]|uniref:Heme/hemopexin transporter protein HuxB n=1 Tax=Candidatus Methylocalor cossyra TaxID=3108543 RepID=A0ABM9NKE2_9GAMM